MSSPAIKLSFHKKMIVEDEFGLKHSLIQQRFLSGKTYPNIRSAIDKTLYTLARFNKIHNSRYTYPNFKYTSSRDTVEVKCKRHRLFKSSVNNHLKGKGCPKCAGESLRNSLNNFIKRAQEVHGLGKYDYSQTIYITTREKLKIICNNCNDYFFMYPCDHYRGYGCPKCALMYRPHLRKGYINHSGGLAVTMYVIKCFSSNEEFYKIGITQKDINTRFCNKTVMPYKFEILYEVKGDASFIWDLENEHHRTYKSYQYFPKINFGGYTECFNTDLPVVEIISALNQK